MGCTYICISDNPPLSYRINWKHTISARSTSKWNGKLSFPNTRGGHATLNDSVWNCVSKNPDTVPASQHKQGFSDSLYLALSSIRTMFLYKYQNSSRGRGLLSSLGVKESEAPGLWSLLQHQSPKSILPAFHSGHRKLCGIQVIYGSFVFYLW